MYPQVWLSPARSLAAPGQRKRIAKLRKPTRLWCRFRTAWEQQHLQGEMVCTKFYISPKTEKHLLFQAIALDHIIGNRQYDPVSSP